MSRGPVCTPCSSVLCPSIPREPDKEVNHRGGTGKIMQERKPFDMSTGGLAEWPQIGRPLKTVKSSEEYTAFWNAKDQRRKHIPPGSDLM